MTTNIASLKTSKLIALLRQNSTLTSQETAVVNSLLSAKSTKSKAKRNSKGSAASELDDIYAALIAPIRRLPIELLSRIFILCLDENDEMQSSSSRFAAITTQRLRITRICFVWRQVARGTPRFWSRLGLKICSDVAKAKRVIRHLQCWSELACMTPLRLDAYGFESFSPRDRGEGLGIETLSSLFPTVKHLSLSVVSAPSLKRLFRDSPTLPQVEILDINFSYTTYITPNYIETFCLLPRLRSLRLPPTLSQCLAVKDSIPWQQLTKLVLSGPNIAENPKRNIDFLTQCINLEELSFDRTGEMLLHPATMIHLPSVQSFSATTIPVYTISCLLEHLTLPNLQNLILLPDESYGFDIQIDIEKLFGFLQRSGSGLHSTAITLRTMNDMEIVSLFIHVPQLRVLDCYMGSDAYRNLRNPDILPCLEDLTLTVVPNLPNPHRRIDLETDTFWNAHILAMQELVKSRRSLEVIPKEVSQLRVLRVRTRFFYQSLSSFRKKTQDELSVYIDAGLQLQFID